MDNVKKSGMRGADNTIYSNSTSNESCNCSDIRSLSTMSSYLNNSVEGNDINVDLAPESNSLFVCSDRSWPCSDPKCIFYDSSAKFKWVFMIKKTLNGVGKSDWRSFDSDTVADLELSIRNPYCMGIPVNVGDQRIFVEFSNIGGIHVKENSFIDVRRLEHGGASWSVFTKERGESWFTEAYNYSHDYQLYRMPPPHICITENLAFCNYWKFTRKVDQLATGDEVNKVSGEGLDICVRPYEELMIKSLYQYKPGKSANQIFKLFESSKRRFFDLNAVSPPHFHYMIKHVAENCIHLKVSKAFFIEDKTQQESYAFQIKTFQKRNIFANECLLFKAISSGSRQYCDKFLDTLKFDKLCFFMNINLALCFMDSNCAYPETQNVLVVKATLGKIVLKSESSHIHNVHSLADDLTQPSELTLMSYNQILPLFLISLYD